MSSSERDFKREDKDYKLRSSFYFGAESVTAFASEGGGAVTTPCDTDTGSNWSVSCLCFWTDTKWQLSVFIRRTKRATLTTFS